MARATAITAAVTPSVVAAVVAAAVVVSVVFTAMAVVVVPAAVIAAVGATVWRAAARWWLLHKVHRLGTCVVAGAMFAPILGMAWGHIQIDG